YAVLQGNILTVNAPGILSNDTIPPSSNPVVEFLSPSPSPGLTNTGAGGFILDLRSNPTFTGTMTLQYVIHSLFGDSNVATVSIQVTFITFTKYPLPNLKSVPQGIGVGPDGALWFAEPGINAIGRITTAGAITEYPLPVPNSYPNWITT